jgi:hypothetical protein
MWGRGWGGDPRAAIARNQSRSRATRVGHVIRWPSQVGRTLLLRHARSLVPMATPKDSLLLILVRTRKLLRRGIDLREGHRYRKRPQETHRSDTFLREGPWAGPGHFGAITARPGDGTIPGDEVCHAQAMTYPTTCAGKTSHNPKTCQRASADATPVKRKPPPHPTRRV